MQVCLNQCQMFHSWISYIEYYWCVLSNVHLHCFCRFVINILFLTGNCKIWSDCGKANPCIVYHAWNSGKQIKLPFFNTLQKKINQAHERTDYFVEGLNEFANFMLPLHRSWCSWFRWKMCMRVCSSHLPRFPSICIHWHRKWKIFSHKIKKRLCWSGKM